VLQTLQGEHEHLVSQVDTVRDTAIEIIAHSNRYSKTVEPLLTLLNQRWQEVTNRLKVFPTSSLSIFLSAGRRDYPSSAIAGFYRPNAFLSPK